MSAPPNENHNKSYTRNASTSSNKKKNKFDKGNRKRSKSFSGGGMGIIKTEESVLPTRFLLGGNITDPLNLNSLQDEEINRAMNAVTPKSSPLPTPPRANVIVIKPRNIHDPLRLIDCADDAEYEQDMLNSIKKAKKKRLKKRRTISATTELIDMEVTANSEAKTPENKNDSARIPEILNASNNKPDLSTESPSKRERPVKRKSEEHRDPVKRLKLSSMDKIVSPVVRQPCTWPKRSNPNVFKRQLTRPKISVACEQMPQFKDKDKKYQYGNYDRYYGYRNPDDEVDHRLKIFMEHLYLFEGKEILDIGCNIGHITLSIGRDFGARSVIGIDIDKKLIGIAWKNVRHYVKSIATPRSEEPECTSQVACNAIKSSEFFPISMPILYGPIDIPGFEDSPKNRSFPNNVTFKQCNYVLDDDSLINVEQPTFDTILCLSVTKWIHLNWGDDGIKQAFRRMYAQLKPGGKLILEAQNWPSYKQKKKLTETIYKNYNSIEFFPDKFTEYLLSPIVGFAKSENLAYPYYNGKGFTRPIQIFTKSTMFPSERIEATPRPNVYSESLEQNILKTQKTESQPNVAAEEDTQFAYTSLLDSYFGPSDVFEPSSTITKDEATGSTEAETSERLQSTEASNDSIMRDDGASREIDSRIGFNESQSCSEENSRAEFEIKENNCYEVMNGNSITESLSCGQSKYISGDNT